MGSAITYARRYSLSAICGIAADEDDDANAAVSNGSAKQAAPVKIAPAGFDDWLADMDATADEGLDALKAAWEKSKPEYRKHLTASDNRIWEALKARAMKAKVPVSA
jgi:hypothetical protein